MLLQKVELGGWSWWFLFLTMIGTCNSSSTYQAQGISEKIDVVQATQKSEIDGLRNDNVALREELRQLRVLIGQGKGFDASN